MNRAIVFLLISICSISTCYAAKDGRYVRVVLPGVNRYLHLAEVKVFENGVNVALSKPARQSSTFRSAIATRATDGGVDGHYFRNSVMHTSNGRDSWWEVDLGAVHSVERIDLFNRTDCCADRINPGVVQILNSDHSVIWQANINETNARYSFVTDSQQLTTSGPAVPSNILRNSSFTQLSSPPLPDFWDLHHAAALRFPNLHQLYGVDLQSISPVGGTNVLKVVNPDSAFSNMIVMAARLAERPADGRYLFSFYAKASKNGARLEIMPWWPGTGLAKTYVSLSNEWKQYKIELAQIERGEALQPIFRMVDKAEYFLVKPELVALDNTENLVGRYLGQLSSATSQIASHAKSIMREKTLKFLRLSVGELKVFFEYNLYFGEVANLSLEASKQIDGVSVNCDSNNQSWGISDINLSANTPRILKIPTSDFVQGEVSCTVVSKNGGVLRDNITFDRQPPKEDYVRINRFKQRFEVNAAPFRVIGIGGLGTWNVPDRWFFDDLKARGFNTVVFARQPRQGGGYFYPDIDKLLKLARDAGLKVVIGFSAAGKKPVDFAARARKFLDLVEKYRNNSTILAWYIVDEPNAQSWTQNEIQSLYQSVKLLDPYRPAFVNWAYDAIPGNPLEMPVGGPKSTDVYSFDYYPFAGKHSLPEHSDYAARVTKTAEWYGFPVHSWLQLYGTNDAWREPTPEELSYLACSSLLFGQMFSYWDTKSNSPLTWDRVATINTNAEWVANNIFDWPDSQLVARPTVDSSVAYSMWRAGGKHYAFVANTDSVSVQFDLQGLVNSVAASHVSELFAGAPQMQSSRVVDFAPNECRLFMLE